MLNNNNIKIKPKSLLEIKKVLYMGDEGGIGCVIPFKNATELLLVSLTHLRIKEKQPFVKEIKDYQSSRKQTLLKELKGPARMRDGVRSRIGNNMGHDII